MFIYVEARRARGYVGDKMSRIVIDEWIDGYSNCGTKIKTAAIKSKLYKLNETSQFDFQLVSRNGLWFIARVVA